jgi:hypothetical protein
MSVSAHALFCSDDISERNLSAILPPCLQCLTITDDLHWLENVQMCFKSSRSLAFFQSYFVGDKVLKRYEKSDDDRQLATEFYFFRLKGNLEDSGR